MADSSFRLVPTQRASERPGPPDVTLDMLHAGENEYDSALGDDLSSSFTQSLNSSVLNFKVEYGHRYHSFREGRYFLSNDEQEQDRLDILHAMMIELLNGKLFWAPIGSSPDRVLDIGTGTGIWAIDFADQYPSAEVIGNDLSPIQPAWLPANVRFIVDDIEDSWNYESNPFSYVHARYLAGAIRDWPALIGEAYRNIKPGGWLEFQDWDSRLHCTDGSVPRDSDLWMFHELLFPRLESAGYNASPAAELEGWFRGAGFVNVQAHCLKIPLGTWPSDRRLKQIGAFNRLQFEQGMEMIALGCLTRAVAQEPAWSLEEVQILVAKTKKDLTNPRFHAHYNFYVVFGQVPP